MRITKRATLNKGTKRKARRDKKARRQMARTMKKGAKRAIEQGIDESWIQKYGSLYRRFFHTRAANNRQNAPEPSSSPMAAVEYLREWLQSA